MVRHRVSMRKLARTYSASCSYVFIKASNRLHPNVTITQTGLRLDAHGHILSQWKLEFFVIWDRRWESREMRRHCGNGGIAVSGDTGDRGSSTSIFISVSRCMNHFCIHASITTPDFATRWWTDQTEIQVSEALQVLRRDQVLFRHSVCREEVQLNPSLLPTDLPIH
jgi:hypothetical protein